MHVRASLLVTRMALLGCWVVLGFSAMSRGDGPEADDASLPLHTKIDRHLETGREGKVAPPATDGEFLRRVSLDLAGYIPTSAEARNFLDDPSPYKRARLVARLLDSPQHARRMATQFDVTLMERRGDQHVTRAEWMAYLYRSFRENKPYDKLVSEILSSDGGDAARRGASKFYLDRAGEPNLLTRDVGRLFLGVDLQCAQCHDHPLIDDYKQAHYYGLFAFLSRGQVVQDSRGLMTFGEKATGDVSYSSVFVKKVTHTTNPRVLDGPEIPDPAAQAGLEYWAFPEEKNRSIPRYSRRAQLAGRLIQEASTPFARNIANRLWAMMMGTGLVQPLDMHHGDNPASDAALLDLLARELVALNFDLKRFLGELALTRVYQRSSEPESDGQAADQPFATAAVRPLSPEQIGWSVLQATGVLANYRTSAEYSLLKVDGKFGAILDLDEKRRMLREEVLEERLYEQLASSVSTFTAQFGGVAGQSQEKAQNTVHQALMMANGEPIQSWLQPSGENLTARLKALAEPARVAEELYLAVLTRRPTSEECEEVVNYLKQRTEDRDAALRELGWALLTSSEFRFNH